MTVNNSGRGVSVMVRLGWVFGTAAMLCASGLAAQPLQVTRGVFIEKLAADGTRAIEPARALSRGDRVVLVVEWRAEQATRGHTLTSAVPSRLTFQRTSADGIEVSTDGGRRWSSLGDARSGIEYASPEDVTHLRWRVPAGRSSGRVTYSAIVR